MRTWRLIPEGSGGRVRMIGRHSSLKPDWGKPTVRNFRGGAGNVSDGRTRTPLHRSKEWNVETLGLRLRAPVLYSTNLCAHHRAETTHASCSAVCQRCYAHDHQQHLQRVRSGHWHTNTGSHNNIGRQTHRTLRQQRENNARYEPPTDSATPPNECHGSPAAISKPCAASLTAGVTRRSCAAMVVAHDWPSFPSWQQAAS